MSQSLIGVEHFRRPCPTTSVPSSPSATSVSSTTPLLSTRCRTWSPPAAPSWTSTPPTSWGKTRSSACRRLPSGKSFPETRSALRRSTSSGRSSAGPRPILRPTRRSRVSWPPSGSRWCPRRTCSKSFGRLASFCRTFFSTPSSQRRRVGTPNSAIAVTSVSAAAWQTWPSLSKL